MDTASIRAGIAVEIKENQSVVGSLKKYRVQMIVTEMNHMIEDLTGHPIDNQRGQLIIKHLKPNTMMISKKETTK